MLDSADSAPRVRRAGARAAFTVLEFLVAFTILALFLTAILGGVSVALRRDDQAAFITRATRLAQSKLAAAGVDYPLRPGVTSGRFADRLEWEASVRPYGRVTLTTERTVSSYWIEVTVSDPLRRGRPSVSAMGLDIRDEAQR